MPRSAKVTVSVDCLYEYLEMSKHYYRRSDDDTTEGIRTY